MEIKNLEVDILTDVGLLTLGATDYLTALQYRKSLDSSVFDITGKVQANTCVFALSNLLNSFTTSTITAPGETAHRLKKGQKTTIRDGVNIVGTYYIINIEEDTKEKTIVVECGDRLMYLLNEEIKGLELLQGLDSSEYIRQVLKSQGLADSDILIDPTLTGVMVISYSITDGVKLANLLNEYVIAADAFVFVNELGQIEIQAKQRTQTLPAHAFDINENIVDVGDSGERGFNRFILEYGKVTERGGVLLLDGVLGVVGSLKTLKFEGLGLKNTPLNYLESVEITDGFDLLNLSSSQDAINLDVYNTGTEAKEIRARVFGSVLEFIGSREIEEEEEKTEVVEYKVESYLIQTKEQATQALHALYLKRNLKNFKIEVVADTFEYKVLDIVTVQTESISLTGYIHSVEYVVQDGVYCTLGIKEIKGV